MYRFTEDAARVVKPGGLFITSGIIQQKKELVNEALIKAGFEIAETILMEDWVAIIARRIYICIKKGGIPFFLLKMKVFS